MNPSDVPVPDRLKAFPFYKGYLIHFTVWVDAQGTPDFRVVHENNRRLCMENDWCALCGQALEKPLVFIGGPKCVESRFFLDGPMHDCCALYAAQTCPYLANPDYHVRPLDATRAKVAKEGAKVIEIDESVPGRPAKMALYYTNSCRLTLHMPTIYYKAGLPLKIDWDAIPSKT